MATASSEFIPAWDFAASQWSHQIERPTLLFDALQVLLLLSVDQEEAQLLYAALVNNSPFKEKMEAREHAYAVLTKASHDGTFPQTSYDTVMMLSNPFVKCTTLEQAVDGLQSLISSQLQSPRDPRTIES